MAAFGERVLGKGIVYGKDTPNFVGNRVGVFAMMHAMHAMIEDGLTIEEVDKVLGPRWGARNRPPSAPPISWGSTRSSTSPTTCTKISRTIPTASGSFRPLS